jgi:phosphatidate cytidylyltransferase
MLIYLFPTIDPSVKSLLIVVIGLLLFFTILFNFWKLLKKSSFVNLMLTRTYSWWAIVIAYLLFFLIYPPLGHFGLFLLSAFGFREIIKNSSALGATKYLLGLCYFILALQFFATANVFHLSSLMIIPFLGTLLVTIFCILFEPVESGIKNPPFLVWTMVLTASGFAHLSFLYSLALKNAIPNAQGIFVYFLFLTQFNDVLQFIWGTIFGKRLISPVISPKKTWEGLIGAVFTTMTIAYFLRFITPLNGVQSLIIGLLLPIFGFWGDLTISMLKRNLKVKDMGTIIPGHGGILDRVDSIILSSFVYFYLIYFWFVV